VILGGLTFGLAVYIMILGNASQSLLASLAYRPLGHAKKISDFLLEVTRDIESRFSLIRWRSAFVLAYMDSTTAGDDLSLTHLEPDRWSEERVEVTMTVERILVIDDDPQIAKVCEQTLKPEGFEVRKAFSGEEGFRLLKVEDLTYDLTLLDIRLPDYDGLDLLSTIREMDPEMAVVIITGYSTMEVVIRALKLGAEDFLLKPFTPEELVASVQKVLEKKRLIRENLLLKARLPILEISKALMSEMNLERLVQLVLATVQKTLRSEWVSLMLLDEERQELSISAALGLPDEVMTTTRVKVGQGLAGLAVQRREPILVSEQAETDPAIQSSLVRRAVGSTICVPLVLKDRVLGVLNTSRPQGVVPFRQDDVDLLSILGEQIAIAIENAQLLDAVTKHERDLQKLSAQLLSAQEAERKRISQELHDEMGQALTAISINLAAIEKELPSGIISMIRGRLEETRSLADQTLEQIRELSLNLRPAMLDDLGLVPTLRWYVNRYATRLNIEVELDAIGVEERLSPETETVLYRIMQEALTNAARHAQAHRVRIRLERKEATVTASIEDDGQGFDVEVVTGRKALEHGVGLLGIRERVASVGGNFSIESYLGQGTRLTIEIPWRDGS
jgi:signal transduction histidine kinase